MLFYYYNLNMLRSTYYNTIKYHHQRVLNKGRPFTANAGTQAAVLPKAGLPPQTQEPRLQFYQGFKRCSSFLLFSASHSLFSILIDFTNSKKDSRGTNVEVRVDLANWAPQTSLKFTTGVNYQFHQGFSPDQRSRNPNHPSPPFLQQKNFNGLA